MIFTTTSLKNTVFDASVQVEYIEFSASIVSLTHLKQSVHQNGIGEFFSCHDLNISISCVEQHAIKCLVRLNGKEPVMIKIMQESIEPLMPTQYIVTPLSLTTMAVGKPIMIAQALINIADSNWKMADEAHKWSFKCYDFLTCFSLVRNADDLGQRFS
jgi:hypothetical protein